MITAPQVTELFVFVICFYAAAEHGMPWVVQWYRVWRGKAYVKNFREGAK